MKSNTTDFTVRSFISTWARRSPETIAITAPDRSPLTYGRLGVHVGNMVETLNSLGIGRNDRVATVLPNGSDMAAAFLAIASGATCAPLNPDYREKEFDFFLSDLNAKALVIQSGMDSPALSVAQKRGMSTIYLSSMSEAGMFSLIPKERAPAKHFTRGFEQPDDIALVLHTSGTTSRPKIVPLTQINICASANNIRESLRLTQNDCCLNIMPLFHIHGLIGATLSTISAGARIICTPGFIAPKFFEWLKIYQPTWYTAVPTMHQAILTRSEENKEAITHSKLRLVRSSSSALQPQVMAKLEGTFNVPVIEAYGMTEASHQIASNPLPPLKRKPGSVGIAAGPEVAIMDDEGRLLTKGETGEIVIRG
ncbi:AMP-binding protein, partial [Candidatus Bathyarchaeota archaeon]|nr:AMP-binding protein [Candidatus Bathyarchaeota archaeon]